MSDISKELDAMIDTFAREVVAQAKGNAYINAKLDLKTRIIDLHIGAAQPGFNDIMRGSAGLADADDPCNLKQNPHGATVRA